MSCKVNTVKWTAASKNAAFVCDWQDYSTLLSFFELFDLFIYCLAKSQTPPTWSGCCSAKFQRFCLVFKTFPVPTPVLLQWGRCTHWTTSRLKYSIPIETSNIKTMHENILLILWAWTCDVFFFFLFETSSSVNFKEIM